MSLDQLCRLYHRFIGGISSVRHTEVVDAMRAYAQKNKVSLRVVFNILEDSIPF